MPREASRRADGLLKLTGRVKEQFKTSKGKYVAPAPIENHINANPMVESCLVSGVGQSAAYALVVLNEELRPRQGDPAVRAAIEHREVRLEAVGDVVGAQNCGLRRMLETRRPHHADVHPGDGQD